MWSKNVKIAIEVEDRTRDLNSCAFYVQHLHPSQIHHYKITKTWVAKPWGRWLKAIFYSVTKTKARLQLWLPWVGSTTHPVRMSLPRKSTAAFDTNGVNEESPRQTKWNWGCECDAYQTSCLSWFEFIFEIQTHEVYNPTVIPIATSIIRRAKLMPALELIVDVITCADKVYKGFGRKKKCTY